MQAKTHVRLRKRVKVTKNVAVNVGKSSASATISLFPGVSVNIGKNGIGLNLGLPGTGLGARTNLSFKGKTK